MPTGIDPKPCGYCGNYHAGVCPCVKAIHADGSVEFHTWTVPVPCPSCATKDAEIISLRAELEEARTVIQWYADPRNHCAASFRAEMFLSRHQSRHLSRHGGGEG